MVRLAFRRYTQIRPSICTLEWLRASTSVSACFTLFRHSSPSFGSQQICSYSNLSESRIGRSIMSRAPKRTLVTSIIWDHLYFTLFLTLYTLFPHVLFARRQPTLTLARQKCSVRGHASSMRIESGHVAKHEQLNLAGRIANSIRFPFNGFTYFLTLF